MSFMSFERGNVQRRAAVWENRPACVCARTYTLTLVPPLQGSVIRPLNLYIKLVLFVLRLLPWWQPHHIIMGLQF